MRKVFNFSAGPAMLPEEVLLQAQAEMLDWNGTGMSVMEIGHRTSLFMELIEKIEKDLRDILNLPANYKVLFLTGGATAQFDMVPINLLTENKNADYIETGIWSKKAIQFAEKYGKINVAARVQNKPLIHVPDQKTWTLNPNAAYVHYTPNETIEGIEFHYVPETQGVPLIADMSSNILSRPMDVNKFGLIYAGAQKNIGQSGITLVIIRDDLIEKCQPLDTTPTLYRYETHLKNQSLYNTPPTFSWYIAGLVFEWIKKQGGVAALGKINQRKAEKLYSAIDNSDFYHNNIDKNYRSWMNIPFQLKNSELDSTFLSEANKAGLVFLKGHRLVGGMRASLYNAMPEKGVDALIDFMKEFEKRKG